jgi:hypothetical protein
MNERELQEELRALAAAEPREAPARVEQFLMARFRARARERRIALWGSVGAGIAAVAAAVAVLMWLAPFQQAPVAPAEPQARYAVVHGDDDPDSFYPLPVAETLPPLESGMVVRVEMPMSSLRLMGVPVGAETGGEPVQADVLLGQDGLARGVRLIQ